MEELIAAFLDATLLEQVGAVAALAGISGISFLGILKGAGKLSAKSAKAAVYGWQTLTEHTNWPEYENLTHQAAPREFIGREDEIANIQRLIDRGQATVVQATITGAGGFGKTTLALEVARQSQNRFQGVWVVRADNDVSIYNSFRELALKMGAENPDAMRRDELVRAMLDRIIKANQPWLLIYDNADSPDVVKKIELAGDHKIRTLITSRSNDWSAETLISIGQMEVPEAADVLASLLQSDRPNDTRADWEAIARRVGGWPLGLVGVAGFLRSHKNTNVADYLAAFDASKTKIAGSGYAKDHPERDSFAAVLGVTTDTLSDDDKALLSVLSYLNPDDLWPEMLREGAVDEVKSPFQGEAMPEFFQRAGANGALITEGFDRLAGLSLIEDDGTSWRMHRMTGEIWRAGLAPEELVMWGNAAARLLNAKMPYDTTDPNNWTLCQRLMDQGRALLGLKVESAAAARFFIQISTYALTRKPQASDRTFADRAVEIYEVLAPNTNHLAASLNNQARFLEEFDDLGGALPIYSRVRSIREALPEVGPQHPDYAKTLNNIAGVHRARAEFSEAVALVDQAREINETALGASHPSTVRSYRNLGTLYGEWARAGAAGTDPEALKAKEAAAKETALERALAGLGPMHQQTALDFNNAAIRWEAQDLAKAFDLMARAAVVRIDLLGPGHGWTLGSLRTGFQFGQANGLTGQAVDDALPQVWATVVQEHKAWGAEKLAAMMAREGIEGEISRETIKAHAEKLAARRDRMREDGAPVEASQWVMQEASYALHAMQFEPDAQAFMEKLHASIDAIQGQSAG